MRSVAISVVRGWPSRKERLLRKLATPQGGFDKKYSREERGDLGYSGVAKQKGEIASQARNDKKEERGDLGCSGLAKQKGEIASQARNPAGGL